MIDRTGGGDHFQVVVTAPSLQRAHLVEQHRIVYDALAEPLGDGTIHELRITTKGIRLRATPTRSTTSSRAPTSTLFMKGTPQFVMCGNSDRALQALRRAGAPITAVDILPDPQIRQDLSEVSGWPTIPQVFVRGELIGGADIVEQLRTHRGAGADASRAAGRGVREGRSEEVVALSS